MWDFTMPGDANTSVWRDGDEGVGLYVNGVKMQPGDEGDEAKFHRKMYDETGALVDVPQPGSVKALTGYSVTEVVAGLGVIVVVALIWRRK